GPGGGGWIEEDVGGLREPQFAGLEERRRERRRCHAAAAHQIHHVVFALAVTRDVDVIGARLLEREPHELAAALDLRPVIELIAHRPPLACFLLAHVLIGEPASTSPEHALTPRQLPSRAARDQAAMHAGSAGYSVLPCRGPAPLCYQAFAIAAVPRETP